MCRSLWTLRDVSCLRGREGGEEINGLFFLAGVWTSPMAFVTTTLALIVQSPVCMRACEDDKSLCRISGCVVAPEVNFCALQLNEF